MTMPSADPSSESMTKSMTYTMPLMFGFFSLQFSSGLSIYFIVSSLVGVAIQLGLNRFMGLGSSAGSTSSGGKKLAPAKESVKLPEPAPAKESAEIPKEPISAGTQGAGRRTAREKGKRRRARKKRR
jgi:YidC/Oxa1 family membrane protein insertase